MKAEQSKYKKLGSSGNLGKLRTLGIFRKFPTFRRSGSLGEFGRKSLNVAKAEKIFGKTGNIGIFGNWGTSGGWKNALLAAKTEKLLEPLGISKESGIS